MQRRPSSSVGSFRSQSITSRDDANVFGSHSDDGAKDESSCIELDRRIKIMISGVVFLAYLSFGLSGSVVGAALLDIAEKTGCEFKDVSYGITARSAAYCVAAILCAIVFDRMNRSLSFIASLIASGIAIAVTPFISSLALYLIAESVYGFFTAVIDVASNAFILELWNQGSNPYMQGLHFCYSIGMTLAPLLAEPFLSIKRLEDLVNATTESTEVTTLSSSSDYNININNDDDISDASVLIVDEGRESRIEVPYLISAVSLFVAAAALIFVNFKYPYKDPKRSVAQTSTKVSNSNSNNNIKGSVNTSGYSLDGNSINDDDTIAIVKDDDEERKKFRLEKYYSYIVIVFGCGLLCAYSAVEYTTIIFFPKFCVELGFSKSKAAFMTSVLSGVYSAARGLSILLATSFAARSMLYTSMTLLTIGNLILLIFATSSETMIWTSLLFLGLGHSCIIPAIYSLCEERSNVTNIACSCLILSSCISPIITPIIVGSLLPGHPLVLIYVNFAGLIACVVLFAALHAIDHQKARNNNSILISFGMRGC